jgi:TonB family protein
MRLDKYSAVLAAMIFFPLCIPLGAQTPDARQHLEELAHANSLDLEGAQPWHLRISFQLNDLNGKLKDSGTIEEWWVSPQSRRVEIRSGSYNLTFPSVPDDSPASATRNRESYLVTELLNQVIHPVPDYGEFEGLKTTEVTRSFGKTTLSCIAVARPPQFPSQFCFTPGTSILRGYIEGSSAVRNNMGIFRGINVGLDDALAYGGHIAISGHVEKLESFHPDGSIVLSTSPSGPLPIVSNAVLSGHALSKPQPEYPDLARMRHIAGTVILCATISKQGTIASLDVISSPSPLLTDSAMQAVRQWTYQPYRLNGSPVEVETTVTVNFNIN